MSRLVVCMDCPNYQRGGYCKHKRKDVAALAPACGHATSLNHKFNPEDNDETMSNPLAPQAQTKTCTKCGRELPISEFYAKAGSKDGLQTQCKDCHNAATERRREKARGANNLPETEETIDTEITEAPAEPTKVCICCGETKPISEFYKDKKATDGHQSYCKLCINRKSAERARKARAEKQAQKEASQPVEPEKPKRIAVRETLTDKQMVELLREHGWSVTCYRTITEEL